MPENKASQGTASSVPGQELGRLKVFLGFAAGVGKSYAMLDEAQRRKSRGQDVVLGVVDFRNRPATVKIAEGLEQVPLRKVQQGDQTLQELDVDAVIKRNPEVVLIDDLSHVNSAGSAHEKRWQDVEQILDAGISVLSTLNVQHLESLNDQIADITGIREPVTIPDRLLREAAEVELVDLTPRALLNRMERGDVFPDDESAEKLRWYTEGNLSALREIALREIAGRVDDDVLEFRKEKGIQKPWATKDRVLICISPTKSSLRLIRRGWRIAQRMHAELVAVYVQDTSPNAQMQKILDDDFTLCERLRIPLVKLQGNVADELVKYAQDNNVTELVIGHSTRSKVQELLHGSIIATLARELRTIDILVVANEPEQVPVAEHH